MSHIIESIANGVRPRKTGPPLTSHRSKAYTFSCSIPIGGRFSSSGAGTPKDSFDPLYVPFVRLPPSSFPMKRSETHPPVKPSRSPCLNAGLIMSSPFEFGRIPRPESVFSASRYGLLNGSVHRELCTWEKTGKHTLSLPLPSKRISLAPLLVLRATERS